MGYRNGRDILPPDLLKLVQQYAEGECLYIPRRAKATRSQTSENARQLAGRNEEIRRRYADGCSVRQLTGEYYLSPQSIYKILRGGK